MKNRVLIWAAALGLLAISIPLFAHHGTGISYDMNKVTVVKGVITQFNWVNPHSQLFFDVKDDKGNVVNWAAEMRAPGNLIANGYKRKEGNTFIVQSNGYDERTWLDSLGYPHSEDMTLEERWTHPDAETLEVTMTLTDAKAYTKPWVGGKQTFKLQLPKNVTVLEEVYCVPSEEESFNTLVRNPAGLGKNEAPADTRRQIQSPTRK